MRLIGPRCQTSVDIRAKKLYSALQPHTLRTRALERRFTACATSRRRRRRPMSHVADTPPDVEELGYDHEEYMLEPVPKSARRKTIGIAAIWVGFGFVVTGLIVGGELAGQGGAPGMSMGEAVTTIGIGELVLFALTILLSIPAMKTGFNLALLSKVSYGEVET